MKRCLSVEDKLILSSSGNHTEFIIDEVVGVGGSCIAYKVSYKENEEIIHKGILKEFFPSYISSDSRTGTEITVPEAFAAQFAEELESFKNTYRVINEYLSNNLSASNYHTVQMGLYTGNNTAYTLTACDYGKSYDKINDENLYSVLKLMLSVTKAVELYHNAGFLHLDIKPKNILVLDEVTDIVKLFDFDSLTSIEGIRRRETSLIPVPEDYYVPELVNCDIRNIGVQTDIFEIGAMLFSRIFGRAPSPSDMKHDSTFDMDTPELLIGVSPQVKYELNTLIKKTIQISRRNRYQTTTDLKNQLNTLISIVDSKKPYIMDMPKWQPSAHAIGREIEIKEIKHRLDVDGYVFVRGIGGLGKSEIAKLFAKKYEKEFHTVQFCKYEDSLKTIVAGLSVSGLNDITFGNFDELVKEKNKILHTSDSHTLLIIDNFNVTHDDFLREFLPSNSNSFKVIFTTRCQPAASYYEDKILNLSKLSLAECKTLFSAHAKVEDSDDIIVEIIKTIDYNTLVLILLAEAIKRSSTSPALILEKLQCQKLDEISPNVFHEYDITSEEVQAYNKINAHLKVIFDISKLSNNHKEFLKNMTLVSYSGIRINTLLYYCDSVDIDFNVVCDMADQSWVNIVDNENVAMHPIVSDLIAADDNILKQESYYKLAECLEDYCNPDYRSHISVVMNKLGYALQLERRYICESEEKQVLILAKLGQLYANIYRPTDARKKLIEAEKLAINSGRSEDLPYIYSFIGEVEKDFGTITAAMEFYQKSIHFGRAEGFDDFEIVVSSMMNFCECLISNGDYAGALVKYEKALKFAERHNIDSLVYAIAVELVNVSKELNNTQKQEEYEVYVLKYEKYRTEDVELPDHIKKMNDLAMSGDYETGMIEYEAYLSQLRNELGEESPIYRDVAQSRWIFYAVNGNKDQAIRLASENLAFIEKSFGAKSMEMAEQLTTMAQIFPRMCEYDYAIDLAQRAIEICKNNGEEKSYIAFRAVLAMAKAYYLMGKLSEARSTVANIEMGSFSGTEAFSEIVGSVGFILCELSRYDIVEVLCAELLERQTADNMSKTQAYILLAICEEQQGNLSNAEEMAENANSLLSNLVDGPIKSEWMLQYYRIVSRLAFRLGDYKKAAINLSGFIQQTPEKDRDNFDMYQIYLERGLYYSALGDLENSEKDYSKCEQLLRNANMPEDAFILLYNNIAINYINHSDLGSAQEYLDKIIAIHPEVVSPASYRDALICNNIGWIALNKDNVMYAGKLLARAAKTFKNIGATNTFDYLTTIQNLALAYEKRGVPEKSLSICETIFDLYDESKMDSEGKFRIVTDVAYVRVLLSVDRVNDAFAYCKFADAYYHARFGKGSSQRLDVFTQFGAFFKMHQNPISMQLFDIAHDAAVQGQLEGTVLFARLLNYIGVCATDFNEEHEYALKCFNDSKDLFDKLGATDEVLYPIVISNIEYAKEKVMDSLIKDLADSMLAEEGNEDLED